MALANYVAPVLPIRDCLCLCKTNFPISKYFPTFLSTFLPNPLHETSLVSPLFSSRTPVLFHPSTFLISHPSVWGIILLYYLGFSHYVQDFLCYFEILLAKTKTEIAQEEPEPVLLHVKDLCIITQKHNHYLKQETCTLFEGGGVSGKYVLYTCKNVNIFAWIP